MTPEAILYRDYRLAAVHQPPFWQVSVAPTRPDQVEANLPIVQKEDREAALQAAKDLVDDIVDGPAGLT